MGWTKQRELLLPIGRQASQISIVRGTFNNLEWPYFTEMSDELNATKIQKQYRRIYQIRQRIYQKVFVNNDFVIWSFMGWGSINGGEFD